MRMSLGHVLQRCHRTHHQRIQRHDCILRHVAKRLREKDGRSQRSLTIVPLKELESLTGDSKRKTTCGP
ncbi:hypothetical protein HPB49_026344 [Dermacentor silvarum]|nr:hypothetical protein HPB49_026344 [Dermacentor silvarum]